MIQLIRTNSNLKDFKSLVKLLDKELAIKDGDDHDFYHQFNKIDNIKYAVIAYENNIPLACGAIKEYNSYAMEIKRMYVLPESRGKGIASKVLKNLEVWATELNYKKCILETGKKQPEAIKLYKSKGYVLTSNYGQYKNIENSLCFEKILAQ